MVAGGGLTVVVDYRRKSGRGLVCTFNSFSTEALLTTIFAFVLTCFMPGSSSQLSHTCASCLRPLRRHNGPRYGQIQSFSKLSPLRSSNPLKDDQITRETSSHVPLSNDASATSQRVVREPGAMSRRLAEATEDALLEGGRAGRKAVEEAGFSDELKNKLLEKLEAAKFRAENASAFTEAGLSSSVGRGSRDIATGQAWSGIELPEDSMLRMLDDARKPLPVNLRGKPKIPNPLIDLRLQPKPKMGTGQRIANARDKTSIYAIAKDSPMSDKEREEMRKELKERFTPGARAMPNSFRGLAALANERIEDAIARGQFKVCSRSVKGSLWTFVDDPRIFLEAKTSSEIQELIIPSSILPSIFSIR